MDLQSYANASVVGVPLLFVVIGLVEWCKSIKNSDGNPLVSGNQVLVISMLIGVLLGGGYMLMQLRPPTGPDWWPHFVYWFGVLVYGLGLGVVASGIYDASKAVIVHTLDKLKSDPAGK
jgi:hypothetical protein